MPASNNALLDLVPERAGVISAMRGVFRSIGSIIGTAMIVVILELHDDKAAALRFSFTAYGALLLAAVALTFLIPDMPRDRKPRGGKPAETPRSAPAPAATPGAVSAPAP
jgi:hypothetical protein